MLFLDIHSFFLFNTEHPVESLGFQYRAATSAAIRPTLCSFRYVQNWSMVWWVMCFWDVLGWELMREMGGVRNVFMYATIVPTTMICCECIFSRIHVPRASGQRHSSIARPFRHAARQRRYDLRGLYFLMRPESDHSLLFEPLRTVAGLIYTGSWIPLCFTPVFSRLK